MPFNDYFEFMGFERTNLVFNLGKLNFILLSVPLVYLLYFIAVALFKKGSRVEHIMKRLFHHSYALRFVLEGTIELFLYSLLNIFNKRTGSVGLTFCLI